MSRSYKKPFVKMANDVEFQKMANLEFRRKTKMSCGVLLILNITCRKTTVKRGIAGNGLLKELNYLFQTQRELGNSKYGGE